MTESSIPTEIHIVGGIDDRYAQHLGVTFASILANVSPGITVHLYVLSAALSLDNRQRLEKTAVDLGASIRFLTVDASLFDHLPITGHINKAMYLRLAIPDTLPAHVEKAIYLDSDIVVTENIAKLWSTDIGQFAVGAVHDEFASYRCRSLSLPEGQYFNSGVMLMNLSRWRTESIGAKVLAYVAGRGRTLHFPDQDALNAVLAHDWLELPSTWNADMKYWTSEKPPAIIHYTDVCKPWSRECRHRFKGEYYRYLRLTEWRSFKPTINWKVVGIQIIRRIKIAIKHVIPNRILSAIKGRVTG